MRGAFQRKVRTVVAASTSIQAYTACGRPLRCVCVWGVCVCVCVGGGGHAHVFHEYGLSDNAAVYRADPSFALNKDSGPSSLSAPSIAEHPGPPLVQKMTGVTAPGVVCFGPKCQ
jgi:hypothetical protein